jgi:hypothetical protein
MRIPKNIALFNNQFLCVKTCRSFQSLWENEEAGRLDLIVDVEQCFSTFVSPRPGKFFFIKWGHGPNK